jgi:glutathionyl-hydroquinone reductase
MRSSSALHNRNIEAQPQHLSVNTMSSNVSAVVVLGFRYAAPAMSMLNQSERLVLHALNTADVMQNDTHTFSDKDGAFRRKPSTFRNFISSKPDAEFPAEKDRYALYIHIGCPWAHRANIMRTFKGLEDLIQLIVFDTSLVNEGKGWGMSGKPGFEEEPLYGFTNIKELYQKASPGYEGRCTVPMVWDKKTGMSAKNITL